MDTYLRHLQFPRPLERRTQYHFNRLAREIDEENNTMKLKPNIQALLIGTVSGGYAEWPMLRKEVQELLLELRELRNELAILKELDAQNET